jgi:hypothetical protein
MGWSQSYYNMGSGNFSEQFTGWAAYPANWNGLAVNATGTIPSATRITAASTSLIAVTSGGGVQSASASTTVQLLSTGAGDNSTSTALELNLNFAGRNAGILSFTAAQVANSTGNRGGTLRVYYSLDNANWSEITGTDLPFLVFNNVAKTANISLSLPPAINNQSTVKLRFYYHNGTGGTAGSRPKISIDELAVTSTSAGGVPPTITNFSPNSGLSETVVTITGTDFSGATAVSFNGVAATSFTVDSATSITATAPTGVTTGPIYVTTAGGTATSSGNFTVPVLAITVPSSIIEGDSGQIATVTATPAPTSDLTITLASSSSTDLTVDGGGGAGATSTATISANGTEASFFLNAPADSTVDNDASVNLTATAASGYKSATAIVTVRNLDFNPPSVVINKFENTAVDVIELLVIANGAPGATVDMRGMLIKDHSSDNASDGGGKYVFSSNSLWQAVPAGTLIVLTLDGAATDANVDGFIVRVGLNNTDYFTKGTGTMNLANTDLVMIKQAGSAEAGSVGMIHALANGASTQTQTAAAVLPKLVANVGSAGVIYASNPNSTIADYNGSSVALGAAATIPFGSANNPANAAFIAGLRGTKDISISIEANAVIVNEDAGVQADKITVALSVATTSDLTVNLSATPADIVNLPASVTIPAGSSSVTVGFTPINDNTSAGNRTVTIAGSADTWSSANSTVTVVDVQFTNPSVVINEVVNSSADSIELLVIQNNLSMVGMILKDFSGDMGGDSGGSYTFNDVALWQSVKAGTLVVLTSDATATEDTDPSDGLVTVKLTNPTYFTAAGSFAVSTTDMVMIKAAASGASGIAGAIHTFGNGPAGTLFKLANGAKLLFTAGSAGGGADNATSAIVDYNGTGATGGTATLGAANNANNQIYITALRDSAGPIAPSSLSYTPSTISGTVEVAISSLTPTVTGTVDTYSVSPALPSGLSINTSSGVISGTPTAIAELDTYTVTAANAGGSTTATVTVEVAKGTPSITAVPTASAITDGQALSASTLSGGTASVAGAFAWTTPSEVPAVGTATYGVTFTPTDTANYNSVTGTVSVTVNSADTPQEQYLASYGLEKGTPDAAGTADPDGDGMDNNTEFAFGTSPVDGSSRAVTQTSVTGGIKITWLQRSGVTYAVKSTDNLGSGFSGPVSSTPVSPQPDGLGDYQQYEATLTGGDRGFIQVEATVP